MPDLNLAKEDIRGFAGLINNVVAPLNENVKFKEKFTNKSFKILLNAVNLNYAASIILDHGILYVKSIPNKPKENLSKKSLNWDGFIEMDSQIFLAIAMKRISLIGVAMKWLTRKIKMRGILKLLNLLKMFNFLTKSNS